MTRLARAVALVLATAFAAAASATPAQATPVEAGFRSFSFGKTPSAPTAKDPQSKLWFHDGSWWGTLWNSPAKRYEIYRLDWATQTWSTTGTAVDERAAARSDMLSDGNRLYGVTAGPNASTSSHTPRIHAFSYDAQARTYSRSLGPVQVGSGGTSAASIAKDGTGRLWITYAQNNSILVAHSTTTESTWATPFTLPGGTNLTVEDEPAIVAFDGKVGIMWSNQNTWAYHFAVHQDSDADPTKWTASIAHQAVGESDNHINMKALEGDPAGKVFAVVKTELTAKGKPLHYVLVLKNDGSWAKHVFARTDENHTRAQLAIDQENRRLYVFASAPCCSGGTIYYKETSLDAIDFEVGLGTPLISSSSDPNINNVTTTKQPLTTASGLVAIAGDDRTDFYLHAALRPNAQPQPASVSIDSGPTGSVASSSATFTFSSTTANAGFECKLDGAPFASCTSPSAYSGLAEGAHTFAVRAIWPDGAVSDAAERSWTVDLTAPAAPEITEPTSGSSSNGHVTVAGTAEPETAITVFDGAAKIAVASATGAGSWSVSVTLTDGAHSLTARAVDAAGNESPPSSAVELLVDTLPPETTIDSAPVSPTEETSATFAFSSDDPAATFTCSLDGGSFVPCSSPMTYAGLTQGTHVFAVRATDAVGNVDATPARHEWIVGSALFQDGFESGSFAAWTTVLTGADGAASVIADPVKNGSFAARLSATTTAGSYAYARQALPVGTSAVTLSGHFNIEAEGAAGANVPIFRVFDSSGARIVSLYRQNQDRDKIRIGHSGVGITTSGRLALKTWAFFELTVAAGAGGGTISVSMDGAVIYETSSASLGTGALAAFQIGNDTRAQAFTIVVDDVTAR